jgi:hypothetical protein
MAFWKMGINSATLEKELAQCQKNFKVHINEWAKLNWNRRNVEVEFLSETLCGRSVFKSFDEMPQWQILHQAQKNKEKQIDEGQARIQEIETILRDWYLQQ